ncbi:helix-turn-helix transcriptional regulator [Paraburkholderia dipogonis]|uniref:helix-turn-helix transcriptional regulator n=1 Tax=Paraburkholderia dipogonis TaxID=1211383 RepID=UPI0038BC00F1
MYKALEARNAAIQDVGGGSSPAPRAPRTQRRTSARKPSKSGDDGEDGPAPARRGIEPIFLDLDGVADAVALSTRGVQRLVQAGDFPKPRAVSGRRVAWLVEDVRAWARKTPVAEMLPPPSGA